MPRALVTGAAGFIGMHLCRRLLSEGWEVHGVDSLSARYDQDLKRERLAILSDVPGFSHVEGKIEAPGLLEDLFSKTRPDIVIHLAAEAGVRASIEDPRPYFESNVAGTFELLEAARRHPPKHLLLASTSSVYGANTDMPYAETMRADWQMSFYAATKKATEAIAHAHSHIYGLPITMFRFFTVYGPWGRPDMAYWLFTEAVLNGQPIRVFNHGNMRRDFVFVDDLIEAIRRLVDAVPAPAGPDRKTVTGDSISPVAPFQVVNIGKSDPDPLGDLIAAIEAATGREAEKIMMDMQQGDVPATWADASVLKQLTGYVPATPLSEGIPQFVDWYLEHIGKNPAGEV